MAHPVQGLKSKSDSSFYSPVTVQLAWGPFSHLELYAFLGERKPCCSVCCHMILDPKTHLDEFKLSFESELSKMHNTCQTTVFCEPQRENYTMKGGNLSD